MEFEWDERKRLLNLAKHGIDFNGAISIWDGDVLETVSPQDTHGEERFRAVGVLNGRVICVVFTVRGDKRRIISSRRARDNERKDYHQAIKRQTEG